MKTEETIVLDETQLAQVTGGAARTPVLYAAGRTVTNAYARAFDVQGLAQELKIDLASPVFDRLRLDTQAIGGVITQ